MEEQIRQPPMLTGFRLALRLAGMTHHDLIPVISSFRRKPESSKPTSRLTAS